MTRNIDANAVAKMLRAALKESFPGVKFSVRKGAGTGSLWLSVTWTDGPTDTAVSAVTSRYKGSEWNLNNNDSYTRSPNALMVIDGSELPEEVHFSCAGITTHRDMSEEAQDIMTTDISSALNGREYLRENMEGLTVNGITLHRIYDVRAALWQTFSGTDLMTASV